MAVGQTVFPEMHPVSGIKLGTACASIKQSDRDDILVIEMTSGATCAAVFTRNAFCAAPVFVARDNLSQAPRWLLINSGNANAGTGEQGLQDTLSNCAALAELVAGQANQVLPFSTGVIGEPLPAAKINSALPDAVDSFSEGNWEKAAKAIMTTDTFAKGASRVITIEGQTVTITGVAKGAGMIQPDMATLLVFVATDAVIAPECLQHCLEQAVAQSFNRITVDGDTSTNDACVLMASGATKALEIKPDSDNYQSFAEAVMAVCKELAETIVRDGEGATKLIRINVQQARDAEEAVRVGKTIANSPLVKTAFFASDPNWGRILAAIGRSGIESMDIVKVQIQLDDVCIVKNGARAEDYNEADGQRVMNQEEITVSVLLGRGIASEQVLSCDFSYDYVRINAEYRT